MKLSLKINLQQFAEMGTEGSNFASFETPTPEPSGGGEQQPAINPLLDEGTPQPATPQELLDFGGRKVPVVDPTLKDLHGDWTELNRSFQAANQKAQMLELQNQQAQQMLQMYQQMQMQQQQTPQPAQPTPEELEAKKEEFMNKFYEDPIGSIQQMVQSYVNPVVEPIARERQYVAELQNLSQKYQDFQTYVPTMKQMIQSNPNLADMPNALENLYFIARGQSAPAQQQPVTPDQLLNDPTFKNQILSNEQVKQQIINDYLRSKQQTAQQTPPAMGSQFTGQAPATPPAKPKTLGEASKAVLEWLNKR